MQRNNQNGNVVDNFTYNYKSGTNQLTSVSDAAAAGLGTIDIDSQPANNYVYNAIGQLRRNNQE